MKTESLSLENPAYVEKTLESSNWKYAPPREMGVMEYWGDGDPAFGGMGDDRPLLETGAIMTEAERHTGKRAVFATIQEAHEAAKRIPNRRKGSILGVTPSWAHHDRNAPVTA